MNTRLLLRALVVLAGPLVASSSHAGLVLETIELGDFSTGGGQHETFTYDSTGNTSLIVGFSVSFTFEDEVDRPAWASDLKLLLDFTGGSYGIGGWDNLSSPWSFQGAGSDPAGFYQEANSSLLWANKPLPKEALLGFTLVNDDALNGSVLWKDVTITLYKLGAVPGPGALTVFAGLGWCRARSRRPS